jgi:hypothetical protein
LAHATAPVKAITQKPRLTPHVYRRLEFGMKMASLIVALVSALTGVASTLCLMKGTTTVPWEMQSWSGQSDLEKAFRRKMRCYFVVGLVTLALAFMLSAVAAALSY